MNAVASTAAALISQSMTQCSDRVFTEIHEATLQISTSRMLLMTLGAAEVLVECNVRPSDTEGADKSESSMQ